LRGLGADALEVQRVERLRAFACSRRRQLLDPSLDLLDA
jgi:hypothetical protein